LGSERASDFCSARPAIAIAVTRRETMARSVVADFCEAAPEGGSRFVVDLAMRRT